MYANLTWEVQIAKRSAPTMEHSVLMALVLAGCHGHHQTAPFLALPVVICCRTVPARVGINYRALFAKWNAMDTARGDKMRVSSTTRRPCQSQIVAAVILIQALSATYHVAAMVLLCPPSRIQFWDACVAMYHAVVRNRVTKATVQAVHCLR